MRTETPAQKQARMEKRAETLAKTQATKRHVLSVGGFVIYRIDPTNICLEPQNNTDDNKRHYYPEMGSAVKALFRKMVEPRGKQDVKAMQDHFDASERRILAALEKFYKEGV